MRVVQDVDGKPIRPADMEIGQLVNGEPEIFYQENDEGEPEVEGVDLQVEKAKAAVIIVKMQPDDLKAGEGQGELGRSTGSCASRRSAPTWAARSPCGSSRRITCCAPVTSPPSTWPTTAASSSALPLGRCLNYHWPWMTRAT